MRKVKVTRISHLNQRGPRVEAGKVKVYQNGKMLRISRELLDKLKGVSSGDVFFVPFINAQEQLLVLKQTVDRTDNSLKGWRSSKESKSILLSLSGVLAVLGLSEETVPGSYRAEVKNSSIYVFFGQKV